MKKNGTSKAAVAERHRRFVDAYLAKGENATQAFLEISPGVAANSAATEGYKLLKLPEILKAIDKRRAEIRAQFALTTDRVYQEIARVAYFNPRRMLDATGKGKAPHELDDDSAAALSIEMDGDGKVLKVRTPPTGAKNTALRQAARILRLEDRPPPPPPDDKGEQRIADPRETAKRMAFLLARGSHATEKAEGKPAQPKRRKLTVPV